MEGTSQKPKSCRFCRVLLLRKPCPRPLVDLLDFRPLGPPKWRELHKSPKVVDFVESASVAEAICKSLVDFLDFRSLHGTAEMEGTSQKPKSCRFCNSAPVAEAISKTLLDFLDVWLLGPLKWREPHKSPKVVDFVESAVFAEAISKALLDFMDFRPLGPLK